LKAEPLRAEDARELEPALSEEVEAAVLRPEEASVDNRALTAAILEAAQRSGAEVFSGNGAKAIWREGNRCADWFCRMKEWKQNGRSSLRAAFRR